MSLVMLGTLLLSAAAAHPLQHPDTLEIPTLAAPPRLDGAADADEYGAGSFIRIAAGSGDVAVHAGRQGGWIHIAAVLPDTTCYWGDDFVVSLDADGSGGEVPTTGDRQWYLRRVADSSFVVTADSTGFYTPGRAPRSLGATRGDADWQVAFAEHAGGWSVELRIRETVLGGGPAAPRITFRTYDDDPHGWWAWPARAGMPAQHVERTPAAWAPMVLR